MENSQKYGVIIADPFLQDRTDKEIEKFGKMIIPDISTDDCVLFLWTPIKYLQDGLFLITEWDYTYYNAYCWRKANSENKGRYDFLLIAFPKKYSSETANAQVECIINALDKSTSTQPVYNISEMLYPDRKKLKLFIHNPREGWDEWIE